MLFLPLVPSALWTRSSCNIFSNCYFGEDHQHPLPASVPRNQTSLEYMISVVEAVEFYLVFAIRVWNCTLLYCNPWPGPHYNACPPTRFRMRRARLRIQLYTELFHQPGDSSDSISDWEERLPEMKLFWHQYDEAEMRECKCIYAAVALAVGHEIEYLL
ncbi:hypothetical protein VTN96DRAFT_5439 [Rasamsonia emersonii]